MPSCPVGCAEQTTKTTELEYESLKKMTRFLKSTKGQGLNFLPLNFEKIQLSLTKDVSLANSDRKKKKLRYVITMVFDGEKGNIRNYGRNRCKIVELPVMNAAIQSLVLGFYNDFFVKHCIEKLLGRNILLQAMLYRNTVLNVVAKDK